MTKASCKHTAKSFSPTASVSFTIFRSIVFMIPSARSTLPIAVGVSRGANMTSRPCDARSFCISPCCAVVHSSICCHPLGPTVEISTKHHKAKHGILVASVVSGFCNIHPYTCIELKLELVSYRVLPGAWLGIFTNCASDQACTLNQFSWCCLPSRLLSRSEASGVQTGGEGA